MEIDYLIFGRFFMNKFDDSAFFWVEKARKESYGISSDE